MKKMYSISLLRLFACISIFVGHIVGECGGSDFPFYFGVMIFLFISGFLYANKQISNLKKFYIKNFIKLLVPTAILLLFELILCLCVSPQVANPLNWASYASSGKCALGHLWFIIFMLACYLLLPVMQKVFDKNCKWRWLAVTITILLCVMELIYLNIVIFDVVFLNFFLGIAFGKVFHKITETKRGGELVLCSIILTVISFVLYFVVTFYAPAANEIIVGIKRGFLQYLASAMSISVSLLFVFSFSWMKKFEKITFLDASDKLCFYVYLYHHIFVIGTLSLVSVTSNLALNIFLVLVVVFVISVLMCFVGEYAVHISQNFVCKLLDKKKENVKT